MFLMILKVTGFFFYLRTKFFQCKPITIKSSDNKHTCSRKEVKETETNWSCQLAPFSAGLLLFLFWFVLKQMTRYPTSKNDPFSHLYHHLENNAEENPVRILARRDLGNSQRVETFYDLNQTETGFYRL